MLLTFMGNERIEYPTLSDHNSQSIVLPIETGISYNNHLLTEDNAKPKITSKIL